MRSASAIDVDEAFSRYSPMVYRRCRQLLGNDSDAADALQDTFVLLVRHRENLEQVTASLLNVMATNVCLQRMRSTRRSQRTHDAHELERIAEADVRFEQLSTQRLLSQFLNRFSASTQTIAVLHYVDGLTLEQVASEVKMSVSGVRKRLRQLKYEPNQERSP